MTITLSTAGIFFPAQADSIIRQEVLDMIRLIRHTSTGKLQKITNDSTPEPLLPKKLQR
jgi:hypothetical protein